MEKEDYYSSLPCRIYLGYEGFQNDILNLYFVLEPSLSSINISWSSELSCSR